MEKGKHWGEALRLLHEMLHRSLRPDVVSDNAAISVCEQGKHWEEPFYVLQEMLHRSLIDKAVSHQRVREGQALGGSPSLGSKENRESRSQETPVGAATWQS